MTGQDDEGGAAAGGVFSAGNRAVADRLRRGGATDPDAPTGANKSVAEMLRAKLRGLPVGQPSTGASSGAAAPATMGRDLPRASPLGNQSEPGREAGVGGSSGSAAEGGKKREVVVLPLVDAAGHAVKGAFGREAAGAQRDPGPARGQKRVVQRYGEDGQRARYFADDDNVDLDTLVKRTKWVWLGAGGVPHCHSHRLMICALILCAPTKHGTAGSPSSNLQLVLAAVQHLLFGYVAMARNMSRRPSSTHSSIHNGPHDRYGDDHDANLDRTVTNNIMRKAK